MKRSLCALCVVVAACQAADEGSSTLDVVRFESSSTESTLHVIGLDASNATVASVTVRRGEVANMDTGDPMIGQEITIDVLGTFVQHTRAGFDPIELPMPDTFTKGLWKHAALVSDPYVARALGQWGVVFRRLHLEKVETAEQAYAACSYTADCNGTGNTGCCQSGVFTQGFNNGWYHQAVCCGNMSPQMRWAERLCDPAWYSGKPGIATPCGVNTGPAGCAPCFSGNFYETCATWGGAQNFQCTLELDGEE
jgi:hypothetical protein